MVLENEQWKLNGDCNKCRKKQYCNKACKACVEYHSFLMRNMIDQATGGIYSYITEKANEAFDR